MIPTYGGGQSLFFFNACEAGQSEAVANFVEGWGSALLEAGEVAGAAVAAAELWAAERRDVRRPRCA